MFFKHASFCLAVMAACFMWTTTGSHDLIHVSTQVLKCQEMAVSSGLTNCSEKVLISVHVPNKQYLLTDKYIKLNTALHWKLGHVTFFNPLILRLRLQKVYQVYPLKYIKDVNSRPHEDVLHRDNVADYSGCSDSVDSAPTCGVTFDNGRPVEGSQGFCCPCGNASGLQRGRSVICPNGGDAGPLNKSLYSSAHCLRFDSLWYAAYSIGHPTLQNQVAVSLYEAHEQENGDVLWRSLLGKTSITVGTQAMRFATNKFCAEYQTSHCTPKELFDYEDSILLLPNFDIALTDEEEEMADMMLVNKHIFTDSGDECNKVGVSFKAFTNQKDRCNKDIDSCLKNQPFHLWLEDKLSLVAEVDGKYWLSNHIYEFYHVMSLPDGEKVLSVEYSSDCNITITVEFAIDEMLFIKSRSKAQILDITSYRESQSSTAVLVNVYNNDVVSSTFTVTQVLCIETCDVIVHNFNQTVHILAKRNRTVTFYLNHSEPCEEEVECNVTILNQKQDMLVQQTVLLPLTHRCHCCSYHKCRCQLDEPADFLSEIIDSLTLWFQNMDIAWPVSLPQAYVLPSLSALCLLLGVALYWFCANCGEKSLNSDQYTSVKSYVQGGGDHRSVDTAVGGLVLNDDSSEDVSRASTPRDAPSRKGRKRKSRVLAGPEIVESSTLLVSTVLSTAAGDSSIPVTSGSREEVKVDQGLPDLSNRIQVRKYVAVMLTKRYPVYYNSTEECVYLKKSGNSFSLCGQIKKVGKSHQFTVKADSHQVMCMTQGITCPLNPAVAMDTDKLKKILTMESVAKSISLTPRYPCLNSIA